MLWVLLAFATAIIVSISFVLTKKEIDYHESIEYSFVVRVIIFILSLALIPLTNNLFDFTYLPILYIASWFNVFGIWFLFRGIKHMGIDKLSPFLNLEVFFVLLFAWLFYGESLSVFSIIGIIIMFIGVLLFEMKKNNLFITFKKIIRDKYHITVLLSVVSYAVHRVISRYLLSYSPHLDFTYFILYNNLFVVVNASILLFFVENINPFRVLLREIRSTKNSYKVSSLVFLQMITEYGAYKIAPRAALVTAIKMSYTVFNHFMNYLFIKRKKDILRDIILSLIVLLGVVISLIF